MTDDRLPSLLSAGTWSGAILSGVGALTLTQWLAIGGFILALAGFSVNTWYKIAMYRLERRKTETKE